MSGCSRELGARATTRAPLAALAALPRPRRSHNCAERTMRCCACGPACACAGRPCACDDDSPASASSHASYDTQHPLLPEHARAMLAHERDPVRCDILTNITTEVAVKVLADCKDVRALAAIERVSRPPPAPPPAPPPPPAPGAVLTARPLARQRRRPARAGASWRSGRSRGGRRTAPTFPAPAAAAAGAAAPLPRPPAPAPPPGRRRAGAAAARRLRCAVRPPRRAASLGQARWCRPALGCRWKRQLDRRWQQGRKRSAAACEGHTGWVNAARFSPAGLVVSGGADESVVIWWAGLAARLRRGLPRLGPACDLCRRCSPAPAARLLQPGQNSAPCTLAPAQGYGWPGAARDERGALWRDLGPGRGPRARRVGGHGRPGHRLGPGHRRGRAAAQLQLAAGAVAARLGHRRAGAPTPPTPPPTPPPACLCPPAAAAPLQVLPGEQQVLSCSTDGCLALWDLRSRRPGLVMHVGGRIGGLPRCASCSPPALLVWPGLVQ